MSKTCEYCGGLLDGKESSCPHCGAPVSAQSGKSAKPRTLEELISFARSHNLPLEKMRFFLGQDYPGPKAFGIYRDGDGSFVVYKNKADGSRAIRYRGPDEAHAVNEIYLKMREEISRQRSFQAAKRSGFRQAGSTSTRQARGSSSTAFPKLLKWILVIAVVVILSAVWLSRGRRDGYYRYKDRYYYSQNDNWYYYGDAGWIPWVADQELEDNYADYYYDDDYDGDSGIQDFENSGYYTPEDNYDYDDDDDDWDWDWDDNDDWDDIGDWDSDW